MTRQGYCLARLNGNKLREKQNRPQKNLLFICRAGPVYYVQSSGRHPDLWGTPPWVKNKLHNRMLKENVRPLEELRTQGCGTITAVSALHMSCLENVCLPNDRNQFTKVHTRGLASSSSSSRFCWRLDEFPGLKSPWRVIFISRISLTISWDSRRSCSVACQFLRNSSFLCWMTHKRLLSARWHQSHRFTSNCAWVLTRKR
jgi:hypothetical protein